MIRTIARKMRRYIRYLTGDDLFMKCDITVPKKYYGSEYGGWEVASDFIDRKSVVYSFGIGKDVSFDIALIERYNFNIYAFDPTPQSIAWVKRQSLSSRFILHPYGLCDFDGDITLYAPKNPKHVSHSVFNLSLEDNDHIIVPVKRLRTIMGLLGHKKIDILKMDIEGAEYDVIKDMIESNIYPGQVLVEFHHRFKNAGIEKTIRAISALKNAGYQIFSISASGEEYGFLKSNKS